MLGSIFVFFDVSGGEIVVIMLFVLMFFGSKKIPELARGLGKGMREFQEASNGIRREIQAEANKIKEEVTKVQTGVKEEVKLDQLVEEFTEPQAISTSTNEDQPAAAVINTESVENVNPVSEKIQESQSENTSIPNN